MEKHKPKRIKALTLPLVVSLCAQALALLFSCALLLKGGALAASLLCGGLGLASAAFSAYYGVYRLMLPLERIQRVADEFDGDPGVPMDAQGNAGELFPFSDSVSQLLMQYQQARERDYSMEMLKKQAELNALQSQINPHFLYNTLDSIRGQMMAEGLDEAADMVEALSRLFRYSINQKAAYNTLEQELENIEDYIRIIRYRFEDRFALVKKLDCDSGDILNCEMPKLTLQPIVENAINHGLEGKLGQGVITIRAYLSDQGLHISVSDDGVGMDASTLAELNGKFETGAQVNSSSGSGIALVNVNERIRLLFGKKYGLYVNSSPGLGTEVHILLPAVTSPLEIPPTQMGAVPDF